MLLVGVAIVVFVIVARVVDVVDVNHVVVVLAV